MNLMLKASPDSLRKGYLEGSSINLPTASRTSGTSRTLPGTFSEFALGCVGHGTRS